jgi:DNA-binding NarL/FixJ family response regulator
MTTPTRPQVTEDERLLLAMVAAGWSHDRIGRRVGRSTKAISNHMSRIYGRLGAANAPHAVAIAIHEGLITTIQGAEPQ